MSLYQDNIILAASSAYTKKFYLNPDFDLLPEQVKDEIKVMCVLYTEEIGGTFSLLFDEEGNLQLISNAEEDDLLYDDIGSVLKIKQLRSEKKELFEQLTEFYDAFF